VCSAVIQPQIKGFEAHLSLKGKDKKKSADSDKEDEQEITEKHCG